MAGQCLADGPSWAFSHPKFMLEVKGVMSEDGERGMIWGVNVLAPYIMARLSLPFESID